MKDGALKFFVRYFDILKIEFHMCILGPKIRRIQAVFVFWYPRYARYDFFRMSKIADA